MRFAGDNSDAIPDLEIAKDMAKLWDNPLGFVLYNYHWGQGDLLHFAGPDLWQIDFLEAWGADIRQRRFNGHTSVLPMRYSTKAGHGVGKSGLVAWIVDFIQSTRPHSKGIVTANSSPQLETKTWSEIGKWHARGLTSRWFKLSSTRGQMRRVHRQHPGTWRCDAMPWRKEQPEAFAGQHAVDSTSYYVNDEASAIDRAIFETQDGGLSDGEPMQFLFGNATRNSGYFYDTHMNTKLRRLYKCFTVDSRQALIPNKEKLEQDVATYGEDSDYIRVKVRGEFPRQSTDQFIASDVVAAARKRVEMSNPTDPLIYGVDVGKNTDECTIYRRRGNDCRTLPPIIMRPDVGRRDWLMHFAGVIADLALKDLPDAIFVDAGALGGGVPDRLIQLQIPNVIPIYFGGKSPSSKYLNRGSYMYGTMRDWLEDNGAIPDDEVLAIQLTTREYFFDAKTNAIMLESKDTMREREGTTGGGNASPDRADGLALTFGMPIGPRDIRRTTAALRGEGEAGTDNAIYRPSV